VVRAACFAHRSWPRGPDFQEIEETLKSGFREIAAVRDATDHSTGENPYIRRKAG